MGDRLFAQIQAARELKSRADAEGEREERERQRAIRYEAFLRRQRIALGPLPLGILWWIDRLWYGRRSRYDQREESDMKAGFSAALAALALLPAGSAAQSQSQSPTPQQLLLQQHC